jgi:glycosyltransferase involved in cell wall biosynthesis
MKVAFLTTSFPRFSGDYAGIFVLELAKALEKRGVYIHILTPHEASASKTEQLSEHIQVTRFQYFLPARYQKLAYGSGIPTNIRRSWLAKLQVIPFLLSFQIASLKILSSCDLIHAHWIEPGFMGVIGKKLYKRPLVVSVHRSNPLGCLGNKISRIVMKNADEILFNSTYTFNNCRRKTGVDRGVVLSPGIDTERFFSKWEHNFMPHSSKTTVLSVGSLIPVKGFIDLIEAIPSIIPYSDCQFIIAGEGPERETLLKRAFELGVNDHITFLNRVPSSEIPRLMRQADIFVLPSKPDSRGDNESLGTVLLEALASGTPCVASNTGGIPDIIDNQKNGFLVSPGNTNELSSRIVTLLQDKRLREEMGKAGREKIEQQYSWNIIVPALLSIYKKFCPSFTPLS